MIKDQEFIVPIIQQYTDVTPVSYIAMQQKGTEIFDDTRINKLWYRVVENGNHEFVHAPENLTSITSNPTTYFQNIFSSIRVEEARLCTVKSFKNTILHIFHVVAANPDNLAKTYASTLIDNKYYASEDETKPEWLYLTYYIKNNLPHPADIFRCLPVNFNLRMKYYVMTSKGLNNFNAIDRDIITILLKNDYLYKNIYSLHKSFGNEQLFNKCNHNKYLNWQYMRNRVINHTDTLAAFPGEVCTSEDYEMYPKDGTSNKVTMVIKYCIYLMARIEENFTSNKKDPIDAFMRNFISLFNANKIVNNPTLNDNNHLAVDMGVVWDPKEEHQAMIEENQRLYGEILENYVIKETSRSRCSQAKKHIIRKSGTWQETVGVATTEAISKIIGRVATVNPQLACTILGSAVALRGIFGTLYNYQEKSEFLPSTNIGGKLDEMSEYSGRPFLKMVTDEQRSTNLVLIPLVFFRDHYYLLLQHKSGFGLDKFIPSKYAKYLKYSPKYLPTDFELPNYEIPYSAASKSKGASEILSRHVLISRVQSIVTNRLNKDFAASSESAGSLAVSFKKRSQSLHEKMATLNQDDYPDGDIENSPLRTQSIFLTESDNVIYALCNLKCTKNSLTIPTYWKSGKKAGFLLDVRFINAAEQFGNPWIADKSWTAIFSKVTNNTKTIKNLRHITETITGTDQIELNPKPGAEWENSLLSATVKSTANDVLEVATKKRRFVPWHRLPAIALPAVSLLFLGVKTALPNFVALSPSQFIDIKELSTNMANKDPTNGAGLFSTYSPEVLNWLSPSTNQAINTIHSMSNNLIMGAEEIAYRLGDIVKEIPGYVNDWHTASYISSANGYWRLEIGDIKKRIKEDLEKEKLLENQEEISNTIINNIKEIKKVYSNTKEFAFKALRTVKMGNTGSVFGPNLEELIREDASHCIPDNIDATQAKFLKGVNGIACDHAFTLAELTRNRRLLVNDSESNINYLVRESNLKDIVKMDIDEALSRGKRQKENVQKFKLEARKAYQANYEVYKRGNDVSARSATTKTLLDLSEQTRSYYPMTDIEEYVQYGKKMHLLYELYKKYTIERITDTKWSPFRGFYLLHFATAEEYDQNMQEAVNAGKTAALEQLAFKIALNEKTVNPAVMVHMLDDYLLTEKKMEIPSFYSGISLKTNTKSLKIETEDINQGVENGYKHYQEVNSLISGLSGELMTYGQIKHEVLKQMQKRESFLQEDDIPYIANKVLTPQRGRIIDTFVSFVREKTIRMHDIPGLRENIKKLLDGYKELLESQKTNVDEIVEKGTTQGNGVVKQQESDFELYKQSKKLNKAPTNEFEEITVKTQEYCIKVLNDIKLKYDNICHITTEEMLFEMVKYETSSQEYFTKKEYSISGDLYDKYVRLGISRALQIVPIELYHEPIKKASLYESALEYQKIIARTKDAYIDFAVNIIKETGTGFTQTATGIGRGFTRTARLGLQTATGIGQDVVSSGQSMAEYAYKTAPAAWDMAGAGLSTSMDFAGNVFRKGVTLYYVTVPKYLMKTPYYIHIPIRYTFLVTPLGSPFKLYDLIEDARAHLHTKLMIEEQNMMDKMTESELKKLDSNGDAGLLQKNSHEAAIYKFRNEYRSLFRSWQVGEAVEEVSRKMLDPIVRYMFQHQETPTLMALDQMTWALDWLEDWILFDWVRDIYNQNIVSSFLDALSVYKNMITTLFSAGSAMASGNLDFRFVKMPTITELIGIILARRFLFSSFIRHIGKGGARFLCIAVLGIETIVWLTLTAETFYVPFRERMWPSLSCIAVDIAEGIAILNFAFDTFKKKTPRLTQ
jgi:hypothetical protein